MSSFVRWTVFAFSLVLVLAGVLPLWHPSVGPTSGAPAYAWFHLAAAAAGLTLALWRRGRGSPGFALVFGLVDLYQWAASGAGWFPRDVFQWTPVDDALHLGLGLALVALGGVGVWASRGRR